VRRAAGVLGSRSDLDVDLDVQVAVVEALEPPMSVRHKGCLLQVAERSGVFDGMPGNLGCALERILNAVARESSGEIAAP
jgi:hypothetical protein